MTFASRIHLAQSEERTCSRAFELRFPPGGRVAANSFDPGVSIQSGRGQPHSKTSRQCRRARKARQRLGVRLSSAAFWGRRLDDRNFQLGRFQIEYAL